MELIQDKQKSSYTTLKESFGYTNVMEAPKITKVVISVGTGSTKDKKRNELIADRLAKITGQKPAERAAKKSIATFKVREGDPVGYQITLRGKRMQDFLNRLIHVALPRTKDFKGINPGAVDEIGNYTLGIKEHTVFPETADEDIKDVFGMAVTVVTTSKDPKETLAYLTHLGFPFKK
jgi:large subunit ribosomal protein L5